jgi:hypothetical protein
MKAILNTLRKKKVSYGRFEISIEVDNVIYKTSTNNTMAIDAAFDDDYDDENNLGRYYVVQFEAQASLINEIIKNNGVKFPYILNLKNKKHERNN